MSQDCFSVNGAYIDMIRDTMSYRTENYFSVCVLFAGMGLFLMLLHFTNVTLNRIHASCVAEISQTCSGVDLYRFPPTPLFVFNTSVGIMVIKYLPLILIRLLKNIR